MSCIVQCFVCLFIRVSLNWNRSCIHFHTPYTTHYVNTKSLEPIEHSALAFNQTMASSSASRKRTKRAVVKQVEQHDSDDNIESGFLARWFTGNMESINEYHREFSQKAFVNPKFLRMEFLRNENLNQVVDLLKFQRLERFVKLSGNIYLDLVKVFLTNMWIDNGVIYSQVKGVDMAITDE